MRCWKAGAVDVSSQHWPSLLPAVDFGYPEMSLKYIIYMLYMCIYIMFNTHIYIHIYTNMYSLYELMEFPDTYMHLWTVHCHWSLYLWLLSFQSLEISLLFSGFFLVFFSNMWEYCVWSLYFHLYFWDLYLLSWDLQPFRTITLMLDIKPPEGRGATNSILSSFFFFCIGSYKFSLSSRM